ncbi:NEW3 domain-containing protein [Rugosimonospora acidiphila]|uniref:NEW3 domain-containing protein n=1 Tax=Rugosimonospora acidiphila TaxID=556531 RepID=UPI0031E9F3B4
MRGLAAVVLAAPIAALALVAGAPAASAHDSAVASGGAATVAAQHGVTPPLGWSSWSFIRHDPSATNIEAQADAMKSSGLAKAGFQYVNVDDFWYQCPGSQGPNVDSYGRWVTDPTKFAPSGATDGIKVTADYVHSDGLKFGLYVTPGISKQAVAQNTAIEGTSYHADDIATTANENNYNCKGMVGIDYTKPGAQEFINSWADEFASWGVDYIKIDGVGVNDIPDIQAWSTALKQTGRPIHLELSNNLAIGSASTWQQLSDGWRTGGDIECYSCESGGSSFPLTSWSSISSRFNQVASWQPYGGPDGFNDYDSLEIGNGSGDGLTLDERKTQMSLWSLAASPLILGTDLTNLDPTDLSLLKNTEVLKVDQDAIDASRIANSATQQVFAKKEPNGQVIVGLFNTGTAPAVVSTTASAIGLSASGGYLVNDLWSHKITESGATIAADVPSHGVALLRITPSKLTFLTPPSTTLAIGGLSSAIAGQPVTATETFTNNGVQPVQLARLGLTAPSGWTVTPTSATSFGSVAVGKSVQATFRVVAPAPATLFQVDALTGTANYQWYLLVPQKVSVSANVTTGSPVSAPYRTYSSATDAPASFAQGGQQFGISGAGADLFSGTDGYSTTYLSGAVGNTATLQTEVVSQQNLTGYGKAGIIVRNDMTASGTGPEGVILFESPSGGIQLEWDNNGGTHINAVTPPNGTIPDRVPVWLKLIRNGSVYTGYYSTDGASWSLVGTADVPAQAATQDAGMFVTSHATGAPAQAVFNSFTVDATAQGPGPISYEAESSANTLGGGAKVSNCTACSGGQKVGFIGNGGTVTFNNVTVPAAGDYQVTIAYLDGSTPPRQVMVSADGGTPQTLTDTTTADFNTLGTETVTLPLVAGSNTIEFANPAAFGPDIDRITVAPAGA